jgi:hypothetical protein
MPYPSKKFTVLRQRPFQDWAHTMIGVAAIRVAPATLMAARLDGLTADLDLPFSLLQRVHRALERASRIFAQAKLLCCLDELGRLPWIGTLYV